MNMKEESSAPLGFKRVRVAELTLLTFKIAGVFRSCHVLTYFVRFTYTACFKNRWRFVCEAEEGRASRRNFGNSGTLILIVFCVCFTSY
jgi:hypothetical protein